MIIGLAGFKRTGKDTFASYFPSNFTRMAFAEPLKQAAAIIYDVSPEAFSDDLKDATNEKWGIAHRDMLINVGQKMREVGPDHWVKLMESRISNAYAQNLLPLGCTDPEMLRKLAEHFRKASYELISYEMERQHAPTSTTEPSR